MYYMGTQLIFIALIFDRKIIQEGNNHFILVYFMFEILAIYCSLTLCQVVYIKSLDCNRDWLYSSLSG